MARIIRCTRIQHKALKARVDAVAGARRRAVYTREDADKTPAAVRKARAVVEAYEKQQRARYQAALEAIDRAAATVMERVVFASVEEAVAAVEAFEREHAPKAGSKVTRA